MASWPSPRCTGPWIRPCRYSASVRSSKWRRKHICAKSSRSSGTSMARTLRGQRAPGLVLAGPTGRPRSPRAAPAGRQGPLAAQGLQGQPGPGGQLQVEERLGIAQLEAGQLTDALEPVLQRAAVHGQGPGGGLVAAAALEVLGQGLHQLGVLALVVAGQRAEPL